MARDSCCVTLEKVTIIHTFRVREVSSLPDPDQLFDSTDHLFFHNASYPESEMRITPMFYCLYILPLHFCNVLAYAFVAYTRTAKASVRENCLCFQWDLPVSLLLAIYFLSNDYEKLLDVKWELPVHASYRTKSIIKLPSIAYRPLRTNLNLTQ